MRRRLLLYMGALAALLLFSLFAVLLLLGQLKSPREEMKKSLTFQMEAFRSGSRQDLCAKLFAGSG